MSKVKIKKREQIEQELEQQKKERLEKKMQQQRVDNTPNDVDTLADTTIINMTDIDTLADTVVYLLGEIERLNYEMEELKNG